MNTLEPENTSTVKTKLHLGLLHHDQGRLRKAEDLHTQALAGYEKGLGPEHIPTILAQRGMTNLSETPLSATRRGILGVFGKNMSRKRRDKRGGGEKSQNCNKIRRFRPGIYIEDKGADLS